MLDVTGNALENGLAGFETPDVLAWQRGLARMELSLNAVQAAGRAGDAEAVAALVADARANLDGALARRIAAASPSDLVDLLDESLAVWMDLLAAVQENNLDLPPGSLDALEQWWQKAGEAYFASLGVEAGEFDPVLNNTVLTMDRFSASAALRNTLDFHALAQYLGIEDSGALPLHEALGQLVTRLNDLHEADTRDTLERRSFELFFILTRQRLELMERLALMGLDEAYPEFTQNAALFSRWDTVAEEWLNSPSMPRRRDSLLEALRYLSDILAYVPDKAGSHADTVQAELVLLLDSFISSGRDNPALTPRDWLEWLEGGLLADRLGRKFFTPFLTEPGEGADPRSALQILVDGVVEVSNAAPGAPGSPQVAYIDEASGYLLREIHSLRLEIAGPGLSQAERDARRQIRLAYLEALTRLAVAHRDVAARLYDEAAATPGTFAFVGDLLLPGNIRVHELAGAARWRPATGFLSGRFSGAVDLPKFGARLRVPNASFDTRGNFALSAHGQSAFPAGTADQVTLRVPARRPLSLAISDRGDFSLSGGADLLLPGGYSLSGYLSIDDPHYVFELAYGGAIRFALLKDVTLLRPVVDPQALPDLETLGALAEVFGSLGTGFEAFLSELDETDFPSASDLDPGEPPDHRNPVSTIPLDAWDAWLVSVGNGQILPLINGTASDTHEALLGMVVSVGEEFSSARNELEASLQQVRVLRKRLEALARSRAAAERVNDNSDFDEVVGEIQKGIQESLDYSNELLASLPETASLPLRFAAMNLAISSAAEAQSAGLPGISDTSLLSATLESGALALLGDAGLNPNGSVADPEKFAQTDFRRRMVLSGVFRELGAEQSIGGLTSSLNYTQLSDDLLDHASDWVDARLEEARPKGDMEEVALNLVRKMRVHALFQDPGELDATDLVEGDVVLTEMLEALHARNGVGSNRLEYAREFVMHASGVIDREFAVIQREINEALGRTPDTRVDLLGDKPSRGFFELLSSHWEILQARGLLDPGRFAGQGDLIRSWMHAAVGALGEVALNAQGEAELAFVEQNFQTLYETLSAAVDSLVFLEAWFSEDTALIDQWRTTWEPLHLTWVGVAESRKAWWLLAASTRNLADAAERYGDGLSAATAQALHTGAGQALLSLQSLTNDLAAFFNGFSLEEFLFPLPGDLVLDRLFGRLEFNRVSGFWRVVLGGQLRFPDIGLFFSLDQGVLSSSGDFSLALRSRGPVPFGLGDEYDLDIANAFSMSGNLLEGSISDASAEGTLIQRLDGGGAQTYTVAMGYSYLPPPPPDSGRGTHRFVLNAGVTGGFEMYTEDLVIFEAGLGVTLEVGSDGIPQQGSVSSTAVVGMFATGTAEGDPTPDDFELRLDGFAEVATDGNISTITLHGVLYLPKGMTSAACGSPGAPQPAATRAFVTVPPTAPLVFTHDAGANTVAFAGSLALGNIRFSPPHLDRLWLDVCSMNLQFGFADGKPTAALTDLNAALNVPLPDERNVTTQLELSSWNLNRLPQGEVTLLTPLPLLDVGGFRFEILPGTSLEIDDATFTLSGVFRGTTEEWFEDAAGNPQPFAGTVAGSLAVTLPADGSVPGLGHFDFDIPLLTIGCPGGMGCEYFLGGEGGLAVLNPSLTLLNPLNALRPTPDAPFVIDLSLGVKVAPEGAPAMSLEGQQMQLIFDGSPDAPLVSLGSLQGCVEFDDDAQQPYEDLPVFISKFCLRLKNITGTPPVPVPLFPGDPAKRPAFSIDNLEITLSGGIDFEVNDEPLIYGEFSDLTVFFVDGVPTFSLDGIGFGVNLEPFLGENLPFAGLVYLGGLQSGNYYFSGLLQGNVKGNMVQAIAALDMTGPRGLCIGLAGAEAAIPLAYGFVLTGARGGLIRGSGFQDPCEFVGALGINPATGRPADTYAPPPGAGPGSCGEALGTWEELLALRQAKNISEGDMQALVENLAKATMAGRLVTEAGFSSAEAAELVESVDLEDLEAVITANRLSLADRCPTPGNCPPPTLGFLAQPHPEAFEDYEGNPYRGRAIIKGSSLDEAALNFLGINRELVEFFVPDLGLAPDVEALAALFAMEIRNRVETSVPGVPSDLPEPLPDWAEVFQEQLEENMNALELGLYNTMICFPGIQDLPDTHEAVVDFFWGMIRDTAYAGVPYEDITLRLEGSFSYTGVSTFASVTAGVMISTSGATGVQGSINVFGIPFGFIRGFTTNFDAYGNYSPAFCGELVAAVGPLELGRGGILWDCPGCEERFFNAFPNLANALTAPYALAIMESVAPGLAVPGNSLESNLLLLDADERMSFVAEVLNQPPTLSGGQVTTAFREFLVELGNSLAPRMVSCAATQPKLFGFSLNGDNALMSSIAYFGPEDPENIDENSQFLYAYGLAFSPFQMTAQTLFSATGVGAILGTFVPAVDQARFTSIVGMPMPGTLLNQALTLPGPEFIDTQFRNYINNAVDTFEYQLAPLGLELSRASGRLLYPSYDHHPAGNNPRVPPWERGLNLPTRLDVLLAALNGPGGENLLGDPFWKGTTAEVGALFEGEDFGAETLHLRDDYFPHGGLLGAATVDMPALITRGLPENFATVINPDMEEGLLEWLEAVGEFLGYLSETDGAGQLGYYIPAPNPPGLLTDGFPASPGELMNRLRAFDPVGEFAELYPIDRAFFLGEAEITVLGLPLSQGHLALVPGDGQFEFQADILPDTWLSDLFGSASLLAEMKLGEDSDLPLNDVVQELSGLLQEFLDAHNQEPTPSDVQDFLPDFLATLLHALERRLPRVGLEANLEMTIPEVLEPFLWTEGQAAAQLFGFTPRFDPAAPGETPYDIARRNGGIGFRGQFTVGYQGFFGIDIEDASVAILGAGGATPRYISNLSAPSGSYGSFAFEDVTLFFDTQLDPGGNLAVMRGSVTPPDFGPLFRVENLAGGEWLSGSVLIRESGGLPVAEMLFDPAQLVLPMFGNATAMIYGDDPESPWGFSPDGPWSFTLEIPGTLEFQNPLEILGGGLGDGDPVLVVEPADGATGFLAELSGTGLDDVQLRVTIPPGLSVTAFPGQPHEVTYTSSSAAVTCLVVHSDGRAYFDSGTREMNLGNNLAHLTGRVEFGVEPPPPPPVLAHTTPTAMTVIPGNNALRTVTVTNTAPGSGLMVVDASLENPEQYDLTPARHIIPAGESRDFFVRFMPRVYEAEMNTNLILSSNAENPLVLVPLQGSVTLSPRHHVTATLVDFGLTPTGIRKSAAVTITNPGQGTLLLADFAVSGEGFALETPGDVALAHGESHAVLVSFQPALAGVAKGALTYTTNVSGPQGSITVDLTGEGENRHWVRQRRGDGLAPLHDVGFDTQGRAFAVGPDLEMWRGREGGKLWQRFLLEFDKRPSLNTVTVRDGAQTHIAGSDGVVLYTENNGNTWSLINHTQVANPDYTWHGSAIRRTSGSTRQVVLVGENQGWGRIVMLQEDQFIRFMEDRTEPTVFRDAFFRNNSLGLVVGDNASVLRTTDGGVTWVRIPLTDGTGSLLPIPPGTHFRGVAATSWGSFHNFVIVGDNGIIVRTMNANAANPVDIVWELVDSGTTETLRAITRSTPNRFVAVGDNGVVLNGGQYGATWTREYVDTTADFLGIGVVNEGTQSDVGNEVWAVTHEGDIFHRLNNPIQGPVVLVNSDESNQFESGIGEPRVWEVIYTNQGTVTDAALVNVGGSPGFSVVPLEWKILEPGASAVFHVMYEGLPPGETSAAATVTASNANSEVEFDVFVSTSRLDVDYEPLGHLAVPGKIDLGPVFVGEALSGSFNLRNVGHAPADVHGMVARHDGTGVQVDHDDISFAVMDLGDEMDVNYTFVATEPGRHRGTFEIASDANNGVAVVEWVVEAVARPQTVVLNTWPQRAGLQIDNNADGTYTTYTIGGLPHVFTVVDGPVAAGSYQIQRGTVIRVRAFAASVVGSLRWEFQGWDAGGDSRDIEFVAGESAAAFTARYAKSTTPDPAPGPVPDLPPADCSPETPMGITAGPWLRVTEAKLTLPWLPDPTEPEFAVEGELFLSLERASGMLRSGQISLAVPEEEEFGPWSGLEMLRLTPLGWSFELDVPAATFELACLNPGLRVLDQQVTPPARLLVSADLNAATRRAVLEAETLEETPIVPGLAALGPGALRLESNFDLQSPELLLSLEGGLRAIGNPLQPGDWLLHREYTFLLDPTEASLPGISFPSELVIFSLPPVEVRANSGTQINLEHDGNAFTFSISGLLADFLGNDEPLLLYGDLGSDGSFDFSAFLPENPPDNHGLTLGPVKLSAMDFDDPENARIQFTGNPFSGGFRVVFPQVYLNSIHDLWEKDALTTPGPLVIDSERVTLRLPLSLPSFGGIETDGHRPQDVDNYLELRRRPDGSSFRIRNRRDYFLGRLNLRLDLDSDGNLNGRVSGKLGAPAPYPMNFVNRTFSLPLTYEFGAQPIFVRERWFHGVPLRLMVIPGFHPNGRACILTPEDGEPMSTWPNAAGGCIP